MAAQQAALLFKSRIRLFHLYRNYSKTSSTTLKKGLVLGVYTKEAGDSVELTESADKYNTKSGGNLLLQLNRIASNLKKGDTRLLYNVDDEYFAVSIVALRKESQNYDELEEIDQVRESARAASAAGAKNLQSVGVSDIVVEDFGDGEAAAEGANLAVWSFQELKNEAKRKPIAKLSSFSSENKESWKVGSIKAEAQNVARRLMEMPSNLLPPIKFADEASSLLRPLGSVQVDARDKSWAETQGMGAFLSVAQGSAQPPVFLELTYSGAAKDMAPIALVGKGVTFDTGGISIKPAASMEEMRADMGGGACVLASVYAAAKLKLPINIKGIIPLCENMPSSRATRPGDIVRAMNGKTIQIDNTDAEGRLILADALCYSQQFKPRFTLDIATLTGAMRIALGGGATGVFTNSSEMWRQIQTAGVYTGDRVWRMPLWAVYSKPMTDYPSVDVNNIGKGKGGGACKAAAFLKEFVGEGPWMHLDMAGVMGSEDEVSYLRRGYFTGRPTRTLIRLLQQLSQPS